MSTATVQTSSEPVGKDRVKLRVEVAEDALGPAISAAYRKWSQEMKVPGFRKGKVPRQIIDTHVGPGVVREEALREALPAFYRQAMEAEGLEALAPPEVEVVTFEPGAPIVFEATVDVRPEIELPDLSTIEVEAPSSAVTDDDLAEQLDRLRDRFAELETISREARRGDHVLIDIRGYQHDQAIDEASATDVLYEVGSGNGPPKLDAELEGNRPGSILKFTDRVHIHRDGEADHDHSHMEEVSFTVLLKEVKMKKLPEADDEFAKTVGEFDTFDDLKDDLRKRLAGVKTEMVEQEVRTRTLAALVEATDLDAPERLVEQEFEHRLAHAEDDLRRSGMTLDQYAQQAGLTELEIRRDIREETVRSFKAELILEDLARREKVDVTEEDIGREIALVAARAGRDPKEVAEQVVEQERLGDIAADIMRRKALDRVVERVKVMGRPEVEPDTTSEAELR
ncbi:MAG: trigger factor [Actinobacteria bacterium]|nr:trigger factor [Actinomycetota bacterium]